MLPDDLPDNVIPFPPRRTSAKGKSTAGETGTTRLDSSAPNPTEPKMLRMAPRPLAAAPPAAKAAVQPAPIPLRDVNLAASRSAAAPGIATQGSETVSMRGAARAMGNNRPADAVRLKAPLPAAAPSAPASVPQPAMPAPEHASPPAKTDPGAPLEMETAMPVGPARTSPFSWRRISLILVGSFVLGIGIAGAAIALGAHIMGVWPHGFALYAMLVGGGFTMFLTAALMGAVFYSDSSGHDAEVQQIHPAPRTSAEDDADRSEASSDRR